MNSRPFLIRWLAVVLLAIVALCDVSFAQVRVRGYTRKDGTYVSPHYRSSPDGIFSNNWSTKGNVNPYTGKIGTKTSPSSSYGGDVFVNGYTRKDGTYVSPHYRSAPDGDFSNNWSTKGNINPYTGKEGTKTLPSGVGHTDYNSPSSSPLSAPSRFGSAASGPITVRFPSRSSPESYSLDEKARIKSANDIRSLGIPVDWQDHSLNDLVDMKLRIQLTKSLASKGWKVDWSQHTLKEMLDLWTLVRSQEKSNVASGVID